MKRFNALYMSIYDMDNIRKAHTNSRRGKRHYQEVKMVDSDPDKYLLRIHNLLKNKTFKNSSYDIFTRNERGKTREIYKLPYFPDRIIHHCILQILEPIWMKIFIKDTYASMKNRGIHAGVQRMKRFLKDREGTAYCLKMDIRKYYPSVDHDILKTIIRRKIKCLDTLWLLDAIIDSAPGIPIGNYLSQYFANIYLAYFDHWVKDDLKIKYYSRYCDDLVFLHSDKRFLHRAFEKISEKISTLKLEIKSNWQIFPTFIRGIDFLGYRFFGDKTLIRKSIAKEFIKKTDRVADGKAGNGDINSMMSYYGWFLHADASGLWRKKITPQVKSFLHAACRTTIPITLR